MKVLLLQPPVQDFYNTGIRLQPIGLAYLKAAATKHLPRIKVIIKDFHAGWQRRTLPFPKEFTFLKPFYDGEDKSPFSTFHHYYHFGADFETLAKDVAKEKPDLVGISSLFAPYYREVLATAEAIKHAWDVPIFIGGSHASAMPREMLMHPAIDFVIRGEGEKPIVEFLKTYSPLLKRGARGDLKSPLIPLYQRGEIKKTADPFRNVPNLGYKKNGQIILNPRRANYPINELPFPDFSDLPKSRYFYEGKPLCFLLTSRGCPYHCGFCSVHTTFGNQYRRRSNENILAELRMRYQQGYRVFDLEDDNLTLDRKAAIELFTEFSRMFPKKDVRFVAMNGICYWNLDEELITLMRQAGFTHLNLSLVSSNQSVLKKIRRPLNLKKYKAIVSAAFNLDFQIVSYQIMGLPGESVASVMKTLALNTKLPVLLGASPFYLLPSAPIAAELGREAPDPFMARLTVLGNATQMSPGDVYTLFITTRILNFLKGIPLTKNSSLNKALLVAQEKDSRSSLGVKILKKLLSGKGFHLATSQGLKLQPAFQTDLFFKLWCNLDRITTQEGKAIRLSSK